MFFEIDDKSVHKDVNFLEEIGTLYDLLIYLLDNSMRTANSAPVHLGFFRAITSLKIILSSMKTDIKDQSEEEKRKFLQNKKMFWVMLKCCLKKEES